MDKVPLVRYRDDYHKKWKVRYGSISVMFAVVVHGALPYIAKSEDGCLVSCVCGGVYLRIERCIIQSRTSV